MILVLNRNKNLAEVWELHSTGSFEDVTEILAESLRGENDNSDTAEIVISRPMQFALILDSYWHLANYKECLRWSEIWLFESLSHYRNSSDEERPQFATMIVNTLQGIVSYCLTPEKRTRLIQTLSSIICHQMEAPENSPEMPIESVAPWILLHHIIKYDEEMKMKKAGKTCHELEDEDEIPPSLKMLFQGHEYLGRRSWCCFNEGALLFHTLNTVYPVMQKLSQESESLTTISQQVDQIFYCLYGQQKKNKGRHIIDHNVLGLAMTWNRAQQVFIFTKPRSLPSYDSSGRCCISSDTEYLYAKLIKLVPDECNPNRLLDEMTKYIEGQINDVPRNSSPLPAEVEDIYYLLAHFYFRNKSWVTNKSVTFFFFIPRIRQIIFVL
ncbi:hypothetical protein AAG570_010109 [Ranatra chinensis]|uniref:Uncharacterized protein n=1 Tax=Ranatra chinensis TaxID=642074 RepID=A0ABD0YLP4_9HEMI